MGVEGRMRYRKLRIAFSATPLAACCFACGSHRSPLDANYAGDSPSALC